MYIISAILQYYSDDDDDDYCELRICIFLVHYIIIQYEPRSG